MTRKLTMTIGMGLTLGLLVAGCGGGDNAATTSAATTTQATSSGGKTLQINMADYSFSPQDATVSAGSVTISTPNLGKLEHEIVLAKTSEDPAALPTTSDGEVDEAKLEAQGKSAGEIADVAPQATKEGKFDLTPGTYVMYCNLPGHYAAGMYGTITVE